MENNFYLYKAVITEVYDGDTCTAQVDLGFNVSFEMKLRLYGIDTPELRLEEREEGLRVRDLVREMILGKKVIIQTHRDRTGKYGRYLAEIFIDDLNLNNWLLESGNAKPYGK
jgi:micrococcal nuclease